jgi:hypothetical protein
LRGKKGFFGQNARYGHPLWKKGIADVAADCKATMEAGGKRARPRNREAWRLQLLFAVAYLGPHAALFAADFAPSLAFLHRVDLSVIKKLAPCFSQAAPGLPPAPPP